MKREIKFKAKRLDNSEWVIGFYTNIQDKEHYILTPCAIGLVHIEVDRETVCQFTGRYDNTKWEEASQKQKQYAYLLAEKNNTTPIEEWKGIEIYEGDKLNGVNGSYNGIPTPFKETIVEYIGNAFNVPLWTFDRTHNYKVTGNIHDQTTADNEN